eukprot:3419401-Pleurochrysis_carterae.AAC.3
MQMQMRSTPCSLKQVVYTGSTLCWRKGKDRAQEPRSDCMHSSVQPTKIGLTRPLRRAPSCRGSPWQSRGTA